MVLQMGTKKSEGVHIRYIMCIVDTPGSSTFFSYLLALS